MYPSKAIYIAVALLSVAVLVLYAMLVTEKAKFVYSKASDCSIVREVEVEKIIEVEQPLLPVDRYKEVGFISLKYGDTVKTVERVDVYTILCARFFPECEILDIHSPLSLPSSH